MLCQIIPLIIWKVYMAFFISLYFISFLLFFIHWAVKRPKNVLELFLLYQIVFTIGITSLLAFLGLTFMADSIAAYFNWPACPFQQELGNVNLSFGVLGILCIWYRGLFWLATIWGFSIWILSDGLHHLFLYFFYNDRSSGNIGPMLYTDILVPIFLLVLLYFYRKQLKNS